MLKSSPLSRKRIANGVYEGVYSGQKTEMAAPSLELNHLGETVSEVTAKQLDEQENTWFIRCNIPTEAITDGIQTFLLCKVGEDTVLTVFRLSRANLWMMICATRSACYAKSWIC